MSGKTAATLNKIRTSAFDNAIQQTPHRQQLRHPGIQFDLLLARQFPPAAGWRNARGEALQEASHLRQVKSTGLRKTQHGQAMDRFGRVAAATIHTRWLGKHADSLPIADR